MCTHKIPFSIKKKKRKSHKIIRNLQIWKFFQGTQERVRNSRGKRAISVRAIEVRLYILLNLVIFWQHFCTVGNGISVINSSYSFQ